MVYILWVKMKGWGATLEPDEESTADADSCYIFVLNHCIYKLTSFNISTAKAM